ncbi:PASTA [[Actinomadura] parvosata subsp. kistnae]|uniref:4a-hydroxytetrahydrobiopterin dehydratase n=1 Tax=[Actinomadura] parvosata TaxID=1955412 RepID=UPI000D28FF7F|nr:4a-hydroxytetrahydrobiopterin dehydratase [Nonomuraea sp. ATCC 55076]SPL92528.1 PASTA [Actinomadura parvosata subsp. kistnae]
MSEIFISYRRADSGAVAGRLYADLQHAYGEAAVFMDTSSIAPGAVWPKRLEEALAQAKVVLVVMGPQWIRAANEWGERLIDQENDWVRREVESALPQDPSRTRVELYREYRFKTFRDAIAFMNEVAPGCDIAIHHPRWENVWRHVRVFLTTWDIGHRISDRDVQLAKYFDSAYQDFAGADPPG